jgi:hypothetical protein
LVAAVGLALWPGLAAAAGFSLTQPVACQLGESCYIQHFVDDDPGPGARDFGCGSATYPGHDGTDFALPTRAAMLAGVDVRAAAPGQVRAARDGAADGAFLSGASVTGKECGNGVLIAHADGWQTQYCHLKQGSVAVKAGDLVAAGTRLGWVGMSGQAEFPHLHLTVRHAGSPVDPFRPAAGEGCSPTPAQTLWQDPAPYVGGGLLQIGLAATPPGYDAVKAGLPAAADLPADAAALVLWGYGFDSRAGDVMSFAITGPGGFAFAQDVVLQKPQALFYRYAGKRAPAQGLAPGRYSATLTLSRGGTALGRRSAEITLRPR